MKQKQSRFKPSADDLYRIEKNARHGLKMNEISDLLGFNKSLLDEFLKCNKDFSRKIKNAKTLADIEVEEALYKRATGYDTTEIHEVYVPIGEDGLMKFKERKFVKKFVPPDASNALIWLFNRKSGSWSKNPSAVNDLNNIEISALRKIAAEESEENM